MSANQGKLRQFCRRNVEENCNLISASRYPERYPLTIYNLRLFGRVPKYLKIHSLVKGLFMVFYMGLYRIGYNVTKSFSVSQGTPVAGVKGGWQGFENIPKSPETTINIDIALKLERIAWPGEKAVPGCPTLFEPLLPAWKAGDRVSETIPKRPKLQQILTLL